MPGRPDIALVSLRTTIGLQRVDEAFVEHVRAAGASCELLPIHLGASAHLRRSMALTDLVEALAARRTARGTQARATVYSTITAALLQPPRTPSAIRFDAIAVLNRPGAGGAWQRRRERPVLGRSTLLLPSSEAAGAAAHSVLGGSGPPMVVVPPPVAPPPADASPPTDRSPTAVAYAGNPAKRGLDVLCGAWLEAAPAGGTLVVGGADRDECLRWLKRTGTPEPPGVEWVGRLAPHRWRALVASARAYVNSSRQEEWGLAQMEALAAGTPLVTVPTPGPNVALPLARRLAPALVAADNTPGALAGALRAGLALSDGDRERYRAEAARLLEPYAEERVRASIAEQVLPVLLGDSSA